MNFVLTPEERIFCLKLLHLFKIDGQFADTQVTQGQILIFAALVLKKSNRISIITSTQYGKSLIVALACIILSCLDGELISIPAPTEDKAKIIMRYYLSHLGDHPLFYSKLERDSKIDKLLMETTKDRLILKNKGGVFILSVQAGNAKKGFEAAMGEGSKTVIQDESALIPDEIEATIFRMIAGKKDATYVKIGNPFYRNHFYKSSLDDHYLHIFIDYNQGLAEGRYTQEFIDEAKRKPLFDILYACQFPPEDKMGSDGYIRLLTDTEIQSVMRKDGSHAGYKVLGVDPAAGGDNSTIVLKSGTLQEVLFDQKLDDVMDLVGEVADSYRQNACAHIVVDKSGIGQGVYDRLKELGFPVTGISFGESSESDMFYNLKAELYWKEREWLLGGGRLFTYNGWHEFEVIKYKTKDGKIIIQSKDELLRHGIQSPNCVDAAVLTMCVKDSTMRNNNIIKMRGSQFHDKMLDIWRGK